MGLAGREGARDSSRCSAARVREGLLWARPKLGPEVEMLVEGRDDS
jgi:hypothetical protein